MREIIQRLLLATVILGLLYVGWWYMAVFFVLLVMFYFVPYELIFVGFLIDAHFVGLTSMPWYTLIAVSCFFVSVWVKPMLYISREHNFV